MESQPVSSAEQGMCSTLQVSLQRLVVSVMQRLYKEQSRQKNKSHPLKRKSYLPQTAGPCTPLTALRVVYLASLSYAQIQRNRVLTKRDIYYMCPLLYPNMALVDRTLAILAHQLAVPRNDLNIVAAPKGLVAGSIAFVEEDAQAVNVAMFETDGCLIPSRPERMLSVTSDAEAVIVVEKETVFRSLLCEPDCKSLLPSFVFVTGKGYPDYATRAFLKRMSECQVAHGRRIPILLFTDADPHGINIAFCYFRDLSDCNIHWLGVRPSDNGQLFIINQSSLLSTTDTEHVLIDHMLKRLSAAKQVQTNMISELLQQLQLIKDSRVKFEMEALAAVDFESERSGLLTYLMQRVCDHLGGEGSA